MGLGNSARARLFLLLCWLCLPVFAQIPPSLTVTPASGEVERAVLLVEADGLQAQTRYRIEIHHEGALLFASEEDSDAAGHIPFPIASTAGDQPGMYSVRLLLEGELVAEGAFELTAPSQASGNAQIAVSPQRVAFGRPQSIRIAALNPGASYSIEIIADESRQLAYRREHQSSADGTIAFEIFAQPGDSPGAHTIAVYDQAGDLAVLGDLHIDAPLSRNARVELLPPAAQAGDSVRVVVSGLAAFDAVSAQLTSAQGVLIDARAARASSEGAAGLAFQLPASLPDGAYDISVFVDGGRVASASLTVGVDAPAPPPAVTATPAPAPLQQPIGNASLTITPQRAPIGSSHRLAASGLRANEPVTIEISFAGEVVFVTTQRADADGRSTLDLITSAEDQPGDYMIRLLRENGSQSSAGFQVTQAESAPIATVAEPAAASAPLQVIEGRLQAGAASLEIDGQAGQLAEIRVISDQFDPSATLIGQDGSQLAANDDSRGGKHAILGPLRLPYSGAYQLAIAGAPLMIAQGAQTGAFQVEIEIVQAAALSLTGETAFALSPDMPRRYYQLPLDAGDNLSLSVDSGGALDSLLHLVDPDGGDFAFDDDSGGGLDAELSGLAIEEAGDYILVVSMFGGGEGTGFIRARHNPVRQLDATPAIVTLNDKSVRERFVFDAADDEVLILNLVKRSGDVADLFVRASVDGMEVMSHSTMGVPDELPLAFVMPMSGRVLLTLEKLGFDDGITLEASLQRQSNRK